jgi:hypothetical protein
MNNKKDLSSIKPDREKVNKDYNEWIKKIILIPAKFIDILGLVSVVAVVILYKNYKEWYFYVLILVIAICYGELARRAGHKEGYLYGYNDGYQQGRDDVLGIDKCTRATLDEILGLDEVKDKDKKI